MNDKKTDFQQSMIKNNILNKKFAMIIKLIDIDKNKILVKKKIIKKK
jgi:hypothetical protein